MRDNRRRQTIYNILYRTNHRKSVCIKKMCVFKSLNCRVYPGSQLRKIITGSELLGNFLRSCNLWSISLQHFGLIFDQASKSFWDRILK